MAYLGNGIYDLLDVVRASNNPQINYEGLYQDVPSNIATSNLLQAMQPGYEYRNSDFINNLIDKSAFDLSGNVPTDFNRQIDFKNYFNNQPLRSNYESLARFENFNPRVGIVNAGLPINNTNSISPINNISMIEDYPIVSTTNEDDDEEQIEYLPGQELKSFRDSRNLKEYFQNRNPLTGIMNLFRNLPTPMNILRGGLESLQGFNQRLRNTDFGRSQTLAEYFQKSRERKQAERAQKAMPGVYASAKEEGFTNDRGGFSTDRADDAGTSLGSGQFSPSTSRGRSGY